MIKKIICFAIVIVSFAFYLSASILETKSIESVRMHLTPTTLIIFDIDNTLIEPVQELGSDQWFCHRIMEYKNLGLPGGEAIEKALSEWTAIQSITKVKPVEKITPALIAQMQQEGYAVMGLTSRGLGLATRTVEQLKSVGIELLQTSPTKEEVYLTNHHGILYRAGILFTSGTHKGNALVKLFHSIDYNPERVVFIDDKETHLKDVYQALDAYHIPFLGLRYGFLDEKVASFNKRIADIQFAHFGHILSDEEASLLLGGSRSE